MDGRVIVLAALVAGSPLVAATCQSPGMESMASTPRAGCTVTCGEEAGGARLSCGGDEAWESALSPMPPMPPGLAEALSRPGTRPFDLGDQVRLRVGGKELPLAAVLESPLGESLSRPSSAPAELLPSPELRSRLERWLPSSPRSEPTTPGRNDR